MNDTTKLNMLEGSARFFKAVRAKINMKTTWGKNELNELLTETLSDVADSICTKGGEVKS